MNCEMCGELLGQDDKVADVEIDLTKSKRFDFVWCENCTKEIVERCV